ncbi:EAL domain-containing protein, partial [Kaarinaea lacus]
YVLIFPTVQHWFGVASTGEAAFISLLRFILLQLVVVILLGMPPYMLAQSYFGRIIKDTGLDHVHISMKTKMLLIGGYIPTLTSAILLKYFWWRTGYLSPEILVAWGFMALIAFVVTFIAIRNLKQSLSPVQDVISSSGASSYSELAASMKPRSIDEVGYLIQTLGKLFHRLGDQESHMHTIVNNAAEGIIVINDTSEIETFNPAAETLFGFSSHEIRGKPLKWLIPDFDTANLSDQENSTEYELNGQHRNGNIIDISLRASRMEMEGNTYYTLLVADISDRKATEKMLLEAEARYRDLVETAHDLVWSMDAEGHWTYLNDAVTRIYGYRPSDMLHRHFSEFQAPESVERDHIAYQTMLRGKDIVDYETIHLDRNGNPRHISFNARPQINSHGQVVLITGTARDITEQKAYEAELAYQAQHDSLTALYNRNFFQQELEREIQRAHRNNADFVLLYLDLDQFKYINDTLGHAAGDRLLMECADLLRSNLRDGDLLARFGGDEFTILLYEIKIESAMRVAEHLRNIFEQYKFYDNGKPFNVTSSIGATIVNQHTFDADEALSQADLACNIAKSQGRNCLHLYNPADRQKDGMAEDMGWASRVRDAFENDKFSLAYQPITSIESGLVHDYEVLLRMKLDDGDSILPGGFMPAAERFGLIHQVDRWVVKQAVRKLSELNTPGNSFRFAINLSARAFEDKELLALIKDVLKETGINPETLTFEITESAAISNLAEANHFIYRLKDLGCQFALDDFGTGFSSFSYLKHLPVDKLKIDGSFVKNMAYSSIDQAMVKSMNQIAHAIGKQTIAEFVEDVQTLDMLREFGIDFAQGNYLGKPVISLSPSKTPYVNEIGLEKE